MATGQPPSRPHTGGHLPLCGIKLLTLLAASCMHVAYSQIPSEADLSALATPSYVPGVFPDARCDSTLSNSPYRIHLANASMESESDHVYCFTFTVETVVQNPCARADFWRLDMPIPMACRRGSLKWVKYSEGPLRVQFLTIQDQPRVNLRLADFNLTRRTAPFASFCMALTGACSRISQFCYPQNGQCSFALVDGYRTCCPVMTMGEAGPTVPIATSPDPSPQPAPSPPPSPKVTPKKASPRPSPSTAKAPSPPPSPRPPPSPKSTRPSPKRAPSPRRHPPSPPKQPRTPTAQRSPRPPPRPPPFTVDHGPDPTVAPSPTSVGADTTPAPPWPSWPPNAPWQPGPQWPTWPNWPPAPNSWAHDGPGSSPHSHDYDPPSPPSPSPPSPPPPPPPPPPSPSPPNFPVDHGADPVLMPDAPCEPCYSPPPPHCNCTHSHPPPPSPSPPPPAPNTPPPDFPADFFPNLPSTPPMPPEPQAPLPPSNVTNPPPLNPSPPPPYFAPHAPPYSYIPGFPNCKCDKSNRHSPLLLSNPVLSRSNEGLNMYCMTVQFTKCSVPNPCCIQDLYKVEFEVEGSCMGSVAYARVDGQQQSPIFQARPWPAVKVTRLLKASAEAANTEICLVLRSPCPTLYELCGGGRCKYALFNNHNIKQKQCCPTNIFDIDGNSIAPDVPPVSTPNIPFPPPSPPPLPPTQPPSPPSPPTLPPAVPPPPSPPSQPPTPPSPPPMVPSPPPP